MGLFNKNAEQAKVVKTPEVVYATARSNLLLVVIFTAVNVILPLIGTDTYFLFSASMPMACLVIATLVEGRCLYRFCDDYGAVYHRSVPAVLDFLQEASRLDGGGTGFVCAGHRADVCYL